MKISVMASGLSVKLFKSLSPQMDGQSPLLTPDYELCFLAAAHVSESNNPYSESQIQVSSSGLEQKLKSVGGASLFLAAVEIAWQLHSR